MSGLRSSGIVLVEASAVASPFFEIDTIVDRCAQLHWDVKKWLATGDVLFSFGDERLSPWALEVRARLEYIGCRVTSPNALVHDKLRTRKLWHIYFDGADGRPEHRVRADRVERVIVPFGAEPPFEEIVDTVAQYAALMSMPAGSEAALDVRQDYDRSGTAEDEVEPF